MVSDVHVMSRSEFYSLLKIEDKNCLMQLDTGCALWVLQGQSLAVPTLWL